MGELEQGVRDFIVEIVWEGGAWLTGRIVLGVVSAGNWDPYRRKFETEVVGLSTWALLLLLGLALWTGWTGVNPVADV